MFGFLLYEFFGILLDSVCVIIVLNRCRIVQNRGVAITYFYLPFSCFFVHLAFKLSNIKKLPIIRCGHMGHYVNSIDFGTSAHSELSANFGIDIILSLSSTMDWLDEVIENEPAPIVEIESQEVPDTQNENMAYITVAVVVVYFYVL